MNPDIRLRNPWTAKGNQMPDDNKSPDKVYATQNLYEAAYCLSIGLTLTGRRIDGIKTIIIFEGENAQKRALGYYNGAEMEAKKLMDNYRTIKDYVFQR